MSMKKWLLLLVIPILAAGYFGVQQFKPEPETTQNYTQTSNKTYEKPQLKASDINSDEVIRFVNNERTSRGIHQLTKNPLLMQSAMDKCKYMAKNKHFDHDDLEGNSFTLFIQKTGYTSPRASENLQYGTKSAEEAVEYWMTSKPHREGILDPLVSETGVATCVGNDMLGHDRVLLTVQHFGQPQ